MAGENINRRLNIYINDREVVNSLAGVNKELAKTRNQMRNLNAGADDYNEQLRSLQSTYEQLQQRQTDFNEELAISNQNFGAARESVISFFTALGSGDLAAAQTAMLGLRGAFIGTAKAAWAFVATPVGAFLVTLAGIAGVTKLWVDYNEEVYKANKLTNGITKLTGDNLDVVRVRAQALSDTFDQDFTKVLETARALVNEFGISYEDALSRLEEGLVKGGAANDEFLDSMREYPTFFAAAGYSIEEFQNLVNSGLDLGIYSDKLPDAIKEFTLSVNEQTKSASDSLNNAFGKEFTDKLLKGIKDGSITAKEALVLISQEAERIGLNAQQAQQLTADLFRGAGEDAGGALKIFEAVRKSLASQKEPLDDIQSSTQQLADSTEAAAVAQDRLFKSDGYAKWKVSALSALNDVKQGFYDLIFEIFNSNEALEELRNKQSEDKSKKQYVGDQLANFEGYVALRKKSMGDLFDFEKVKEERLAVIRKQISSLSSWDMTEQQVHRQKMLEAEYDAIKKTQEKIKVVKNKNSVTDQDAAIKAADEAAKQRNKDLDDAKKHAEALIKQEQDLQKQLLATRRTAEDMKMGLIKGDYDREKAVIDAEYNRKIEDFKANGAKEQDEISKIKAELASSKTSKSDAAVLKKQLDERLEIQAIYNQSAILSEETRIAKIAALNEKYLQKSFQDQETKNARDLQNLKTKQTEELNSVKTLEDAKAILQQYLSDDELSKVTSLSNAKKEIKKRFLKEEYDLQLQQLNDIMAKAREILGQTDEFGLELISGEERDSILKFLDDAAAKLAALGVKDPNAKDKTELDLSTLSGIDILGFSPEQWQGAFDNLDTFDGKMNALKTTVGAVQNAFGIYFGFLEAGERRQTQVAEAAYRKKASALATQLERGYITQEVYNARLAKADQELAKKKAQLEYKQAKREKIMQASSIVANTAMGIMQIWGHSPDPTGISQGLLTAIIGSIGLSNLALVAAQPLPDKNGFYDGGFTGTGNPRSESMALGAKDYTYHKGEYVVPNKVLFSDDPVVPNIVGYLEAKRTGKTTSSSTTDSTAAAASSSSQSNDSVLTVAVVKALDRNSDILEKIEEDGVIAYLENDIKTARKMRDKIKEVVKLETNAKA